MEAIGLLSDDERNLEQARPVELQSISVSSKGIWTFSFLKTLGSQAFFDLHMGKCSQSFYCFLRLSLETDED